MLNENRYLCIYLGILNSHGTFVKQSPHPEPIFYTPSMFYCILF